MMSKKGEKEYGKSKKSRRRRSLIFYGISYERFGMRKTGKKNQIVKESEIPLI